MTTFYSKTQETALLPSRGKAAALYLNLLCMLVASLAFSYAPDLTITGDLRPNHKEQSQLQ